MPLNVDNYKGKRAREKRGRRRQRVSKYVVYGDTTAHVHNMVVISKNAIDSFV